MNKYVVVATGYGFSWFEDYYFSHADFDSLEEAKGHLAEVFESAIYCTNDDDYTVYNHTDEHFEIEFCFDAHIWAQILEVTND